MSNPIFDSDSIGKRLYLKAYLLVEVKVRYSIAGSGNLVNSDF